MSEIVQVFERRQWWRCRRAHTALPTSSLDVLNCCRTLGIICAPKFSPTQRRPAAQYGGALYVEPAIAEMCDHMKDGRFAIASHMSELAEEILSYQRDEDYKTSSCGTT
jgi:hypothetical protein